MFRRTVPLIAAALVLLLSSLASAQSTPPAPAGTQTPAAQTQSPPATDNADLSITANVTARELKFEVVPNADVTFTGNHARKTTWEAERQNLPRPVEPGVTYRNIGIQLKIVSVFADIDRIVAEALGEVPITDNIPPPAENQPQQNAQSNTTSQPNRAASPNTSAPPNTSTTQPLSPATTPAGKGRP